VRTAKVFGSNDAPMNTGNTRTNTPNGEAKAGTPPVRSPFLTAAIPFASIGGMKTLPSRVENTKSDHGIKMGSVFDFSQAFVTVATILGLSGMGLFGRARIMPTSSSRCVR